MQQPLQFLFVTETSNVEATLAVLRRRRAGSANIHLRRLDDGALVEVLGGPDIARAAALRVGRELARLPGSRLVKVVAMRRPAPSEAGPRYVRDELASWRREATLPRRAA